MKKSIANPIVVFDKESIFKGNLSYDKSVRIDGKFEGSISTRGTLYISETAEINAHIKADVLVISGVVHGDIEASSRLELTDTGVLIGNSKTPRSLVIEEGATIEGRIDMVEIPGSLDLFSTTLPQLKKALMGKTF